MGSTEFHQRNRRVHHGRHSNSIKHSTVLYTNDPYSGLAPVAIERNSRPASMETQMREVAKKFLPNGTLRHDLFSKVQFFPFPEYVIDRTRTRTEAPPLEQRPASLVQMFFGQLPYKVSDNMIVWLCEQFAEGEVLFIERVMQDKSRKGCMQVFVDEQDADYISDALNKRVLFDATGVWQAQNDEQLAAMEAHCVNEFNRFKGFPFRPMVVERSTSTYVRRHRQPNAPATSSSKRSTGSMTPPPETADESEFDATYESPYDGTVPEATITSEPGCSYYCTCGCMGDYSSPQPYPYQSSPAPYYTSYAEDQIYNSSYGSEPYSSFGTVPPAYEHPPVYGSYEC